MDLSAINLVGKMEEFLPTKKLRDLEPRKDHPITDLKIVHTRYGERMIAEIADEFIVFLPKRIMAVFHDDDDGDGEDDLLKKTVKAAQEGHLALVYLGGKYNSFEFKNV